MLGSSLYSKDVFKSFKSNENTSRAIEKLLLETEDREIRNGVAAAVKGVCVDLPTFVFEISEPVSIYLII